MYDYTPPRQGSTAKGISALLFAAAAVCLICQKLTPLPPVLFQLLAIAALVTGIQLTTRYILTTYTYSLSSEAINTFEDELNRVGEVTGEKGTLWFRVARTQGRKSGVIGGFPLSSLCLCVDGGTDALKNRLGTAEYAEIKRCYNYCNNLMPKKLCTAVVIIDGQKLALTIEPDEKIYELLSPDKQQ